MAKGKITLETVVTLMQKGFAAVGKRFESLEMRMEKRFAAVAEDIADIKENMATKEQIITLHMQVNSIETELRGIKRQVAILND
ncbi:hypothetical protein HY968_01550 [Candidatus Kaiserbacteria bacterium]|nr:hypothetical protein [Candidatus Kaiserbacteria bacterium]